LLGRAIDRVPNNINFAPESSYAKLGGSCPIAWGPPIPHFLGRLDFACCQQLDIDRLQADGNARTTLYADRTSTATIRANQLRLWFASMAYVLLCALRRSGLHETEYAKATWAPFVSSSSR
jgi:hypothetical protein